VSPIYDRAIRWSQEKINNTIWFDPVHDQIVASNHLLYGLQVVPVLHAAPPFLTDIVTPVFMGNEVV
jgi:hypothetical protein